LPRRAELTVIGNQLLVRRIRATLDDDIIWLQLESGDEGVFGAAVEEGDERDSAEEEHPATAVPPIRGSNRVII